MSIDRKTRRFVERVLAAFSLECGDLSPLSLGGPEWVKRLGGTATPKFAVRVPRGRFVVRVRPAEFAAEAAIRFDHRVLRRLAQQGLPVPEPQSRADGTTWVRLGGEVAEVLSWREGEPFVWNDLRSLENLGTFLARFHTSLASAIPAGKGDIMREDHRDVLAPCLVELKRLAENPDDRRALQRIGEQLDTVHARLDGDLYPRLPVAVIHGDVHPGNFRFRHSEVVAVYDFDYLAPQARVRDLADALMFFAARRERPLDPNSIRSLTQPFTCDRQRSLVLLAGYQKVSRLEPMEWEALPWLIRSQWLQVRLRGARKVATPAKVAFVLDRFFSTIEWLDAKAKSFFRSLRAEANHSCPNVD